MNWLTVGLLLGLVIVVGVVVEVAGRRIVIG